MQVPGCDVGAHDEDNRHQTGEQQEGRQCLVQNHALSSSPSRMMADSDRRRADSD
jgi:hypothetical protein